MGNVLWIMAWGCLGPLCIPKLHHCYHFALVCLDVRSAAASFVGQMMNLLLSSPSFASWLLKWEISLCHLHWLDLCSWCSFPARGMVVAPSQVPGVWNMMTPSPARLHAFNACVVPLSLVHWLTISLMNSTCSSLTEHTQKSQHWAVLIVILKEEEAKKEMNVWVLDWAGMGEWRNSDIFLFSLQQWGQTRMW